MSAGNTSRFWMTVLIAAATSAAIHRASAANPPSSPEQRQKEVVADRVVQDEPLEPPVLGNEADPCGDGVAGVVDDIVGDGDARPGLEALAEHLGVAAAVRFHGIVSEAALRQHLQHNPEIVTPDLLSMLASVVGRQSDEAGSPAGEEAKVFERIQRLYRIALRMSMEARMKS